MWDVFISHAREDKDDIARPLAEELRRLGLSVWFDEHTLLLGDKLRQSIDSGLRCSRFGVVVLSPAFFSKDWPQRELDGLVALEKDGVKRILPIRHKLTAEDVSKYSPMLADRISTSTEKGTVTVSEEVFAAINNAAGKKYHGEVTGTSPTSTSKARHKRLIFSAMIGLVGALGAVVLTNWASFSHQSGGNDLTRKTASVEVRRIGTCEYGAFESDLLTAWTIYSNDNDKVYLGIQREVQVASGEELNSRTLHAILERNLDILKPLGYVRSEEAGRYRLRIYVTGKDILFDKDDKLRCGLARIDIATRSKAGNSS